MTSHLEVEILVQIGSVKKNECGMICIAKKEIKTGEIKVEITVFVTERGTRIASEPETEIQAEAVDQDHLKEEVGTEMTIEEIGTDQISKHDIVKMKTMVVTKNLNQEIEVKIPVFQVVAVTLVIQILVMLTIRMTELVEVHLVIILEVVRVIGMLIHKLETVVLDMAPSQTMD